MRRTPEPAARGLVVFGAVVVAVTVALAAAAPPAAEAASASESQQGKRRAIVAAADGGRVTNSEARGLRRAGLNLRQIRLLRTALTRASDGRGNLTPEEIKAILRGARKLPDPVRAAIQRLISASRDGRLTAKERKSLTAAGITRQQLRRLETAMRANGGKILTRGQVMAVYTGRQPQPQPLPQPQPQPQPQPAPGAQPGTPAGGGEAPGGGDDAPILPASQPLSPFNADGYRLATFPATGGQGGQADAQGDLYIAAINELRIFGPDNGVKAVTPLPFMPQDVAPGPDGSYIYAVEGVTPRKLVRQSDGSYEVDPTFELDLFPYGGRDHVVEGIRIATDHTGNLFIADGVWTNNLLNMVVKYDPDGNYVTRFGEYPDGNKEDPSSWQQGRFFALGGIAVSPDGESVYTTEVANHRVQRWDEQLDGTYASTAMWGNTQENDPNRVGSDQPGMFSAPYDIGLDAQGDVYAMNTTTAQIQKFTPDGVFITSMFMGDNPDVPDPNLRAHGIAVTADGDAISTETGRIMERAD